MFRTALGALAALDVAGVKANYDVDSVPDHLTRGDLPALLVLPLEPDTVRQDGLFAERGTGFQAAAFSDGVRTVHYTVTHLLLAAPEATGAGLKAHLPTLVDLIDAYFGALGATVTLGGTLLEPASVRVEPGLFRYGGARYVGCAFRHTWLLAV